MKLIKRYPNRKLYDTDNHQYVTVHEIAKLVLNNEEFKVIDNSSKKDVTNLSIIEAYYQFLRTNHQNNEMISTIISQMKKELVK